MLLLGRGGFMQNFLYGDRSVLEIYSPIYYYRLVVYFLAHILILIGATRY